MKKIICLLLLFPLINTISYSAENKDNKIFYSNLLNNNQSSDNAIINNSTNQKTNKEINTTSIIEYNKQNKNNIIEEQATHYEWEKNKDLSLYFLFGAGTTGLDFTAALYYKNFIGIRGNYSFFTKFFTHQFGLLFIPVDQAISNMDFVYGVLFSLGIHKRNDIYSNVGFDVSIRPFVGKKFFGALRLDIGLRNMNYTSSYNIYYTDDGTMQGDGVGIGVEATIAKGIKPYFGVGWDWNPFLGFTIGFDVGIIYTGKWSFKKNGPNMINMTPDEQAEFEASEGQNIEKIKQQLLKLEYNVNKNLPKYLSIWPVVKLNIGYQFNFNCNLFD